MGTHDRVDLLMLASIPSDGQPPRHGGEDLGRSTVLDWGDRSAPLRSAPHSEVGDARADYSLHNRVRAVFSGKRYPRIHPSVCESGRPVPDQPYRSLTTRRKSSTEIRPVT